MSIASASTRQRRSTEQVRTLLLDAARELFVANGYESTTTRDICSRAGVARNVLFSNFENKQQLFEAAVLTPFADFLEEYARAWEQDDPDLDPEQRIQSWVQRLYDLAQQNRILLLTSVARRLTVGTETDHDIVDALADMLEGLQEITTIQSEAHAYHLDPPVSIGAAAAMVIGTVLLQDLVFPRRTGRPDQARVVREMTTMILHGISHRSPVAPETT